MKRVKLLTTENFEESLDELTDSVEALLEVRGEKRGNVELLKRLILVVSRSMFIPHHPEDEEEICRRVIACMEERERRVEKKRKKTTSILPLVRSNILSADEFLQQHQ